jgi:hypothetical protein
MTQASGGAGFPLPGSGRVHVAVPAPGPGHGRWVGAPSAALDPTAASSSPTGSG